MKRVSYDQMRSESEDATIKSSLGDPIMRGAKRRSIILVASLLVVANSLFSLARPTYSSNNFGSIVASLKNCLLTFSQKWVMKSFFDGGDERL